MKRRAVLAAIAALALIVVVPQVYSSSPGGGCALDIVNNYYSDNTYSSAIGWDERDCACAFASAGSPTSWRYHEVYSCDSGDQVSASCQEYQPGTGWVVVACPDPGVTAQGRLHIPAG